jgi:hypothetical protein
MKSGIATRVFGEEIQEVPLRHQRNKWALSGKARKISHHDFSASDLCSELRELLMWPFQKYFEDAKFVHHLEG